jgi:selenide,water dikinase
VLDEFGVERPALVGLGAMNGNGNGNGDGDGEAQMACGGCAAKLGALPLEAALAALPPAAEDSSVVLGLEARDDVAATRDEAGGMTLHNVDIIRAFCDDPFLVGRVATSNALSDLYAKGGRPRYAQAIIGLPDYPPALARDILVQTLAGIRSTLDDLGVTLLGGHTTIGDFLTVGLSVSGDGPPEAELLRQAGSRPGDDLLLSQPLGTGAVLAADMQGLARGDWIQSAHAVMLHPNRIASRLAREHGAHAATDVTGFGLAGHLLNLLDESGLIARIERQAVTLLPGARGLWDRGLRSTAHPANQAAFASRVSGASDADEAWLFDPQTSGGLLLAVAPERTQAIQQAFREAGEPELARIGSLVAGKPESRPARGAIEVIDAAPGAAEP